MRRAGSGSSPRPPFGSSADEQGSGSPRRTPRHTFRHVPPPVVDPPSYSGPMGRLHPPVRRPRGLRRVLVHALAAVARSVRARERGEEPRGDAAARDIRPPTRSTCVPRRGTGRVVCGGAARNLRQARTGPGAAADRHRAGVVDRLPLRSGSLPPPGNFGRPDRGRSPLRGGAGSHAGRGVSRGCRRAGAAGRVRLDRHGCGVPGGGVRRSGTRIACKADHAAAFREGGADGAGADRKGGKPQPPVVSR